MNSRQCVSACSPLFSRTPPHPTHYDVFNIKYEMYTINIAGTKSLPGVHYSPTHHPQQPTNLQHICCVHTVYKDIKLEKYEIYNMNSVSALSPLFSASHIYTKYISIKFEICTICTIWMAPSVHNSPAQLRIPHIYSGSQIERGEQK